MKRAPNEIHLSNVETILLFLFLSMFYIFLILYFT